MGHDWLVEKNMSSDLFNCSPESLNKVLRSFHPWVQNANGKAYSIASYFAVRSGISCHFSTFNIMNCGTFKSSNDVFKSVIKKRPTDKKAKTSASISPLFQRQTYRCSDQLCGAVCQQSSWTCQEGVVRCAAKSGGREGNRHLTKDSFC